MKIGITCPLYITNWNQRDFVNQTTMSIRTSHEYIWIPVYNYVAPQFLPYVWHFDQHPKEIHILDGRQPQCVSKAWNDGIAKAIELQMDYILVINDDIKLKSNAIDRLVAFAQAHPEAIMWTMGSCGNSDIENEPEDENFSEHPCFSAFMVKPDFREQFGLFDENYIPAYMEDSCAHARMALAYQKAYIYGGAKFYHPGSSTIRTDEEIRDATSIGTARSRDYFLRKWGHSLVNDVEEMREVYYKHPFNDPTKPLSYWVNEYV